MAIRIDPENNETRALFDMVNFSGQHVLEIGSGAMPKRIMEKQKILQVKPYSSPSVAATSCKVRM